MMKPLPEWRRGPIRAFFAHGCTPREIRDLFAASGLEISIETLAQEVPQKGSRARLSTAGEIEALRDELLLNRRQVAASIRAVVAMLTQYTAMEAVFDDALEALRDTERERAA